MIKRPYTCVMPTISQDHNKIDSKLVGKNILVMVEENEQLTILTFIAFVRQEFRYTITYRKAWLTKQWALEQVYDNWEESYNILSKYLQTLQLFIPGTIVRIQTIPALDESNQIIPNKVIFHWLFCSFKACNDVFAFCKPIVQINGTWLYGRYKGTLLITIAQDDANNIFPLTFAIVEGETTNEWHFFFFFCKTWGHMWHHNMVYA